MPASASMRSSLRFRNRPLFAAMTFRPTLCGLRSSSEAICTGWLALMQGDRVALPKLSCKSQHAQFLDWCQNSNLSCLRVIMVNTFTACPAQHLIC